MLRPPSVQNEYDEYFSGDPAFEQIADDATDEQIDAHAARIRIARETGNWAPLLLEGQRATKFVLRPLPGKLKRAIMDRYAAGVAGGGFGPTTLQSVLLRAALVSVEGIEFETVNEYGLKGIADDTVPNWLDTIDEQIVGQLGNAISRRAALSPKS